MRAAVAVVEEVVFVFVFVVVVCLRASSSSSLSSILTSILLGFLLSILGIFTHSFRLSAYPLLYNPRITYVCSWALPIRLYSQIMLHNYTYQFAPFVNSESLMIAQLVGMLSNDY